MSTCGGCDRRWTGLTECHCAACHAHFGSVRAFDMHRAGPMDGDRHCVDPATLRRKDGNPVFVTRARKSGDVWSDWHTTGSPWADRRSASSSDPGNGHPVADRAVSGV